MRFAKQLCIVVLLVLPIRGNHLMGQIVAAVRAVDQEADPSARLQVAQLGNHLKSQLSYIKNALELTAEQQEKLDKLNADWLLSEFGKAAHNKPNQNGLGNALFEAFGFGRAAPAPPVNQDSGLDASKKIINNKINEILTAQQLEQLRQEQQARDDFQAQSLAELTVVLIERQFHLSDAQAQRLVPLLTGKINKNCGWHVYLNNPQFIPRIPQTALSAVLSSDQLQFLRSLNQQDFIGNDFGQMFGFAEEEPLQ